MLTQPTWAQANPVVSERVHAMPTRWLAEPGWPQPAVLVAHRAVLSHRPRPARMSLFVASRLVQSPLASTQGIFGPMRLSQRALHTSSVTRALTWSKQPPAKVVSLSEEQDLKQLNQRRNERPISPHLTIYQPQLTWFSSIGHRFTGVGLSAGLYAYAIAYLAAPHAGLGELLSSGSLVDLVSQMPVWAKLAIKAPLAATFSYHCLNGLRHLSWDWGFFLQLRSSYLAGYTVLAATAASTVGLCML